ncbi:MAG TPA: chemotaxis protein CheD [Gemmatimonadales bacterium]|nr:chemotaxis protein CheD [Gemmatimonadales bacterium]
MTERLVRVADWAVESGDVTLVTLGLGSCVAIVLYDPVARAGGLAHLLLPSPTLARDTSNPGRFPETVLPLLLAKLASVGAERSRLTARLVGGASMFGAGAAPGTVAMGERNVVAARQVLAAAGVPVVGEDVLKGHGRSVYFFLGDGRVEVRTVARGTVVL